MLLTLVSDPVPEALFVRDTNWLGIS
jgi:hypothetical protein